MIRPPSWRFFRCPHILLLAIYFGPQPTTGTRQCGEPLYKRSIFRPLPNLGTGLVFIMPEPGLSRAKREGPGSSRSRLLYGGIYYDLNVGEKHD